MHICMAWNYQFETAHKLFATKTVDVSYRTEWRGNFPLGQPRRRPHERMLEISPNFIRPICTVLWSDCLLLRFNHWVHERQVTIQQEAVVRGALTVNELVGAHLMSLFEPFKNSGCSFWHTPSWIWKSGKKLETGDFHIYCNHNPNYLQPVIITLFTGGCWLWTQIWVQLIFMQFSFGAAFFFF